ncbi:MAG: glycosyltransferase family 39 protein [Solirubrobacterales bacterium]|nr:glycosyltransferase family 39 protein [Solirubrobacterales bacterium]
MAALSPPALERVGLGVLVLVSLVGFLAYPTYPNYDSYYSLLWGRELLDFQQLSFEAYRAPTEHPLAIAFGALLVGLGDVADRVMVFFTVVSFVALVAGVYMLAKTAFTPLVGLAAALLLATRFDFPFLAARGYIDIPYLAVVIWAAVIEARAPRRHPVIVGSLLAAAGLMRPEAWLLAGLYWLWLLPSATWPQRVRWALLTAVGPLVWAATDFAVTGEPLYSLTATGDLANELGRNKGLEAVPEALYSFLIGLTKFPVFVAGSLGLVVAVVLTPRRAAMPLALLGAGVGTFAIVGLAGLSVIERYLLVPSLCVMVFAAVFLAGWTMLEEGSPWRRLWAAAAVGVVIFGVVFTATRVNVNTLDNELRFRGDAHEALELVLSAPTVVSALRCGPVYVPNHKLIPDVRWILDRPRTGVLARSSFRTDARPDPPPPRRGVVIIVHTRIALFKQALVTKRDNELDNLPPLGFERAATSQHYAAYVNC